MRILLISIFCNIFSFLSGSDSINSSLINRYFSADEIDSRKKVTIVQDSLSLELYLMDTCRFDFNRNGKMDLFAIAELHVKGNGRDDSEYSRHLVVLDNLDTAYKVVKLYEGVVSSSPPLQNSFQDMSVESGTIAIVHSKGAKYHFNHKMIFSIGNDGDLLLQRIEKACSIYEVSQKFIYTYSNYNPTSLSIDDSLSNSLNCDTYWNGYDTVEEDK